MEIQKQRNPRAWLARIAVIAGFLSFYLHGNIMHPLLLIPSLALFAALAADLQYKKSYIALLLPFSSGLLCFLMKLFYWDKFDFAGRVNSLLLLSLFFTIILIIRKFDLLKKFTAYFNRLKLKKRLLAIFIVTELLCAVSAGIIVKKGVALGGDEPHYLAISQSLIKDFDLNVFNQYFRAGYKEFIDVKQLRAHGAFGKGYKKMYSIHLPGVAVTIAPFLALKIPLPWLYFLIRAYLGIFGALLAVLVYLFSLKLWQSENLSLFITAVFCLTTPVFFHSFHIFPELQVLLLVLAALYFLLFPGKKKNLKTLLAGLLLGAAIFWGLKYIIFIYLFSIGFFLYFFIKKGAAPPAQEGPGNFNSDNHDEKNCFCCTGINKKIERKRAFLLILFPVLFQALFFSYLYFAYGNFSPMSVYTGMMTDSQAMEYYSKAAAIPFMSRVETLLNYLFDQRDGLLLYSPFYFFAFPGFIIALKRFKAYLPHLAAAAVGIIYILYHGYSTVRPGYCPQARYLVPVMWLFMLFAVIYYREKEVIPRQQGIKNSSPGIAGKIFYLLPIYSLWVVVYQVFHPFTLYQPTTHDVLHRPGLMFSEWSNIYIHIPDFLPSFIKVEGNLKYAPNIIFLALFVLLIILFLRNPRFPGKVGRGYYLLFVPVFLLFILFPRVPLYNALTVQKEGALPYKIYGESKQPGKSAEKIMPITGRGYHSYTISTVNEAKFFILEFADKQDYGVEIAIYNYDNPVKRIVILPGQEQRVVLANCRSRMFKNLFFYRFTLSCKSPDAKPVHIDFQVYPANKLGN